MDSIKYYEHDCENCSFLGNYDYNGDKFDLYICISIYTKSPIEESSLVARYSSEGSNYYSYSIITLEKIIECGTHIPYLIECYKRAVKEKLIEDKWKIS